MTTRELPASAECAASPNFADYILASHAAEDKTVSSFENTVGAHSLLLAILPYDIHK
jgi:hypothetical protein